MDLKNRVKAPHQDDAGHERGKMKTQDIYLSAFLKVKGFKIESTESNGNGRVYFSFESSESLHQAMNEYFNDGLVNALSFSAQLKALKSLVYKTLWK